MKNIPLYFITFVLVVAATFGGAFGYIQYEESLPENKIINVWESDKTLSRIEFKENGTTALVLSGYSINGTYTMNTEKSQINLIYNFLDTTYIRHFNYEFEENKLILNDIDSGVKFVYTRE